MEEDQGGDLEADRYTKYNKAWNKDGSNGRR